MMRLLLPLLFLATEIDVLQVGIIKGPSIFKHAIHLIWASFLSHRQDGLPHRGSPFSREVIWAHHHGSVHTKILR